jgi:transposase-like protein
MTDRDPLYRRHRFPAEIIARAVWLYFRFPLSLRMVEDLLAARGIIVSHQTWGNRGAIAPGHFYKMMAGEGGCPR